MTRSNTPYHTLDLQQLGEVTFSQIIDVVIPHMIGVKNEEGEKTKERLRKILQRQVPFSEDTLFRATAVARTHPLTGERVASGAGDVADRYGIRNRGIILETQDGKIWVIKLFQHQGNWCLFGSRFDNREHNLHQAAA